jgi:hypothetical protein
LAYLLDDLPAAERAAIEERLESDEDWQAELERLRECLAAGGEPCQCSEQPPADLVARTCSLVQHLDCDDWAARHNSPPSPNALAPMSSVTPSCGGGGRWSLADLAVAAGVMCILAALAMPALQDARNQARGVTCQDNLRYVGAELFKFQLRQNHRLPQLGPDDPAGKYSVLLVSRGGVDAQDLSRHLVCPDSALAEAIAAGKVIVGIPELQQWNAASANQRAEWARTMGGDYAYNFGAFVGDGAYRMPIFTGSRHVPVLADAPDVSDAGVKVANHGGCGQFVLFQSMCVRFRKTCQLQPRGDDIYLNDEGRHAAGADLSDVVLGRSEYLPTGRIVPIGE